MLKNFPLLLIMLVAGCLLTAVAISVDLPDVPALILLFVGLILNILSLTGLLLFLIRKNP